MRSRDDSILAPWCNAQYRIVMSLPNSCRPLDTKDPHYDPSVSITSDEPGVSANELNSVDLCLMASEDINRLGWREQMFLI